MNARDRLAEIRDNGSKVTPDELDRLWAELPTLRPEDLIGTWKGSEFVSGHPFEGQLATIGWYGKTFASLTDVTPIVCVDEEGNRYANKEWARGGASLWNVEFRGETTATMVYDRRPILDHFKRIDENTVLGVMNGKGVRSDDDRFYYFLLERE
ncbi:hypothetical protein ACTI_43040 [Actinoplanes sp. OR16]|uniref:DUF4334 domain-containing protein n=1 Tax=Actinoplanes sp. OR16 TaxID=946334 RepID=UPI000F6FD74E|nr:DUF4334 domain-containing protein [Actinoplanes sp. OR16]BBH67619.1 hypothetical protein ACTI_43040 [Actinoplanes sp. OR16]